LFTYLIIFILAFIALKMKNNYSSKKVGNKYSTINEIANSQKTFFCWHLKRKYSEWSTTHGLGIYSTKYYFCVLKKEREILLFTP
jgi:hypothetical protein